MIASYYKYINNPNRIVKNMFSEAENILFKESVKRNPLKPDKGSELAGRTLMYGAMQ